MRIVSVRSFLLSCPLPTPLQLAYYGGERTIIKRDALFIRVENDTGQTGYAPGPATEATQQNISNIIAPFLEGRPLADPDALRVRFLAASGADAAVARDYAAVEIALYDLLGQARGVPISELLGGRVRDRIRVYASAGMYMAPEAYAAEADAFARRGFNGYKLRPGAGPDADVEAVRLVREAVGPDFDVMVDAHTWWRMGDLSYSAAIVAGTAARLAEYDITWLEEPLPPADHEAYLALKDEDVVPLAAGEHEPDEEGLLDLVRGHSVDYVQMDLCCQGGFGPVRRVLAAVEREELRFAFHSFGTALEVAAAAQVGVCWPETVSEWLEYPCFAGAGMAGMYAFPLASEILTEPLVIERGYLAASRAPGLGVKVDESVIARYPWIPGPWSTFRTDSPAVTRAVFGDHSVAWHSGQSRGGAGL